MSPTKIKSALVIAVGDELLAGAHPDLNGPVIARELGALGVAVREVRVVADDVGAIAEAVQAGAERADLVLVTGGLGPTLDDVTRDGIAQALGEELLTDPEALRGLEEWYASREVTMPASNRRQAEFPASATVVTNSVGTAPGFRARLGQTWIVSLPGPPRELQHVLEQEILPWLQREKLVGRPLLQHKLYLFGVPEGAFAERAGAWMGRDADPLISCSAKSGCLWITLRASDSNSDAAEACLEQRVDELKREFGEAIYSESEARLEFALGQALLESGVSFTCAESCSGGLVAGLLTGVAGISDVFERSFVTYSDGAKSDLLGVSRALLAEHGAVSPQVAEQMARGAAQAAGARLAVSITGIAGPGGGSDEKPVGLVFFATVLDGEVEIFERAFPALGRDWVRSLAAQTALYRAWLRLQRADLLGSGDSAGSCADRPAAD